MQPSVIRYRLDLVIILIDTTTGKEIPERNVRFWIGADSVSPFPRGNGSYVLMNTGRDDFDLQVEVRGYEKMTVPVRYEKLDDNMPVKEVFLIPSEDNQEGEDVLTFSGKRSGLKAIDAVVLGQARCFIKEFDERKRIMTLFRQSSLSLDEADYGLIHTVGDQKSFEVFEVQKMLSTLTIKLKEPLSQPFSSNDPISRIVFGSVMPGGNFTLKVRDNAEDLKVLVRYVFKDKVKFEVVDFHQLGEPSESEVM